MYSKLKRRIFAIIQPAEDGNVASRIFDLAIMVLIFASVASVFIATFALPRGVIRWLIRFEIISVAIFTVEYLLRMWTSDLLYSELSRGRAFVKYVFSPMAIIDLVAILPFYLPMILPINLIGIRAIRLVRLLRIFKMNRYSDALVSIGDVFKNKLREITASLFFVFLLLIIASLLIYYAEHDAQPDNFANAFSGLWWAVATLTTVGYGDIYPITAAGRILGAFIAIMGIGVVAIPTGILSSGFVELLEKQKEADKDKESGDEVKFCPYCGKKLPHDK